MKPTTLPYSAIVALFTVVLCAGCAVLTVDVDVYKGPLANTEEIQGEQVISMAMGAKPLLVQLRDHLEVGKSSKPDILGRRTGVVRDSREETDAKLRALRANVHYKAGYIGRGVDGNGYTFKNELAIRVNEILGLYEDMADPSVAATLMEAEALVNEYKAEREILEPTDNAASTKQWTRLKKHLVSGHPTNLVAGYDQFFAVDRKQTGNRNPWRSETFPMSPTNWPDIYRTSAQNYTDRFGIYRDEIIEQHAEALFGPPVLGNKSYAARAEFVETTQRIAESYFQSRIALRRLLRLALISIQELHAVGDVLRPSTQRELLNKLAEDAANLMDGDDLRRWRTNQVPVGVASTQDVGIVKLAHERTMERLVPNRLEGAMQWEKALRKEIAHLLSSGTNAAASFLEIDRLMATSPEAPFGLGRGPVPAGASLSELLPSSAELVGIVATLSKSSGALDRGRPPKGIETYIETYFATTGSTPETAQRIARPEGQELLVALVAFGQKVAQLGNSVVLMDLGKNTDVHKYVTVLQSVGNSILVHIDELKQQSAHHRRLEKWSWNVAQTLHEQGPTNGKARFGGWDSERFDAKDAILQLELLLRAEYIEALRKGEPGGTYTNVTRGNIALKADQLAKGVYTNNVPGADTNLPVSGEIQLGLPSVGGEVNFTNVLALASHSDKLVKAIEAVTEWRSGMIHLRPASAYLRSSYPASLSGHSSSQRSVNMLERQAWKQIPGLGTFFDGVDNKELKTYLELDKQSWQSVNRVKVAGGGKVNYVVAKDDVGNWYVKQYSTDRTTVYNAMRNVAMFSAGNAFGGPLPLRKTDGSILIRTNPVVELQFNKAFAAYEEAVTNALIGLVRDGKGLKSSLWTALTNHPSHTNAATTNQNAALSIVTEGLEKLNGSGDAATKSLAEAPKDKRVQIAEEKVLALGASWLDFYDQAASGLKKEPALEEDYKKTIRSQLFPLLDERFTKLRNAAQSLQHSIDVIKTGTE